MHNDFQGRIIAILRGSANGLTSNEIAELLGPTAKNMSSRLSKLAAYGIIGKVRHSRGPRASIYRALPYEKAAAWPAPSGL
jgi:DNA-binding transcriptional regulator GbsR (MarR family)